MANELRLFQDLLAGRISDNPLTSGATTMNSPALSAMLAVGSTQHMMVTLDPDGVGGAAPEIVMVTAHTASTTSCTIARGQLGTTARQHNNGTDWVHGPLASDVLNISMYRKAYMALTNKTSFSGTSYEQWGTEEAEVLATTLPVLTGVTAEATLIGRVNKNSGSEYLFVKVQVSVDGGSAWSDGLEIQVFPGSGSAYEKVPVVARCFLSNQTVTTSVQARAMVKSAAGGGEPKDLESGDIVLAVSR